MYLAAFMVTGFLVAGWYALCIIRGRAGRYERAALAIPLAAAALVSVAQIIVGDWAARVVAEEQPIKLAAMEGLTRTTRGAPEHLLGVYQNGGHRYAIKIPHLLSLLADHSWNGRIVGLDSVPINDRRPPVTVVHLAFETMAGIEGVLALLALWYLAVAVRRRRLPQSPWFYRGLLAAGPLALVVAVAGWITTEVGRRPWIVYGVMRTSSAVTSARAVPFSYLTLVAVYLALVAGLAWVLRRMSRIPVRDAVHA